MGSLQVAVAVALASGAGWLAGKRAAVAAVAGGPEPVEHRRSPAPTMQLFGQKNKTKDGLPPGWKKVPSQSRPGQFSYLNTKTKERYDRLPSSAGAFYDDEDPGPRQFAWWTPDDSGGEDGMMSDVERAGFSENGRDLATDGLYIYAAFIPFLLFAFLYATGNVGDAYGNGNF
jgi:hypothetical protein